VKRFLQHPVTRRTRRAIKIAVVVFAVIVAAAAVTTSFWLEAGMKRRPAFRS